MQFPQPRLRSAGEPRGGRTAGLLRPLALACAAAALASAAPARAGIYAYQISGNFGNNSGPNKKGQFVGVAKWDTTLNTNRGGWFFWDIDLRDSSGTVLQTFKNTDTYNSVSAGCFASPLASLSNGQTGSYAETAAEGAVCDGSNTQSSGSLPPQSFLNIYTPLPYTWKPASSNVTAAYSYFRLQFQANGAGGSVNPANLQAVSANAQSVAYLGWSAMTADTADGTCTGSTSFPTALQNCPYTGNTQNYQGVSSFSQVQITTIDEGSNRSLTPDDPAPLAPDPEVPAPLPLLGAGAAFSWTRRLRRRLRPARA